MTIRHRISTWQPGTDADPRDIQEALDWAQAHRDELTRKWDELSGAKP